MPSAAYSSLDLPFLVLVLTLVGFGLVMLYSASSAVALYRRGDAFAYLRPVVPADRGRIYSADGVLLAANSSCWTLRASPRALFRSRSSAPVCSPKR